MEEIRERLATTERNQSDFAKSITSLIGTIREVENDVDRLKTAEAVAVEREKARDEWRGRTEKKLDGIYNLGWWVLATFGALTMAALANLLYSGGGVGS